MSIKRNKLLLSIVIAYIIALFLLFYFTIDKNIIYSVSVFILIGFLSISIYYYLLNSIYLNKTMGIMTNIAKGRYDTTSTDDIRFSDIDSNLNMISSRVQKLEEQKDSFINDVSHELRTPLSTIKILSQSIQYSQSDDVKIYKEFFIDIVNEVDRLNDIISDMMDSVDLDPSNYIMNFSLSYLNYLCEKTVKRLQPLASEKNIKINFYAISNLQIYIDPSKIDRAISNIIENAIKYSEENSKISVKLFKEKNKACISIEDQGIGILNDEIDRIFERFYRVKKDRSRITGGIGLGLYIVKKIIDIHQGEIVISSKENKGSIFIIKLPMNLKPKNI